MTIIHYAQSWLAQTETWLYSQVKCLPLHVESHIVCERTENADQFGLPNIHSLAAASKTRYFWDKGLRKLRVRNHLGFLVECARSCQAQVLHSHFGNIGWINIGAAQRGGLKHVVTFYGYDVTQLPNIDARWRDRYAQLFYEADRILCEGSHMAKEIQRLGCPPEKIRLHHLGVQVDRLAFRPRIYRPGEVLRVLIAASFREKKGIPYALEALGRLQHESPIAVTIIGGASGEARDIKEKARILGVIDNFNLGPKIRMLGYQPHEVLFREAYDHHVFLSPSVTASDGDTEGGAPVSIIELAATGMPIISTRHCDIPEVIQEGVTGLLAEEKDVEGLVIHLEALIANPKGWEPMLRASRQHIELEYDARVQGERLARIYRELVWQ